MWNFNRLGAWSVASNPKHDEFFVDENRDLAQSLVREVSQNRDRPACTSGWE